MTSRTSIFDRRRRIIAAAVALSLLPVTACTGGGATPGATAAPESSSPAASPAQTATPTPTASYKPADASGRAQNVPVPVLPEAAKAETKEGLEAFARYWYALLNYGYETGDLSLVKDISSQTCALCVKVFPGIEKWNAEGRWIVGSTITVHAVQSTFVRTGAGDFQVAIQSQQASGSLKNSDGTEAQTVKESGMLGDILVARHDNGSWTVKNVDRLGG
ncbi:DUF6318 family protein [Arthrobacter sp. AL12]|uniref:DUF6318 family protein n=1 Tax=Arthrobacter sp. AL12 TaxID=3042241 RepID=UPI00249B5359|nr:DUF6318 family protein [Arthrobacter sp. AL12]MDI3212654.1 DUF6318 family protein [Arthrobacter sp. AL12]